MTLIKSTVDLTPFPFPSSFSRPNPIPPLLYSPSTTLPSPIHQNPPNHLPSPSEKQKHQSKKENEMRGLLNICQKQNKHFPYFTLRTLITVIITLHLPYPHLPSITLCLCSCPCLCQCAIRNTPPLLNHINININIDIDINKTQEGKKKSPFQNTKRQIGGIS